MHPDDALVRAWNLGGEDYTDEIMDEYEALLPTLIEAGYVESNGHTWNYTKKGVERALALCGPV